MTSYKDYKSKSYEPWSGGKSEPPLPDGYEWKRGGYGDLQLWGKRDVITSTTESDFTVLAKGGKAGYITIRPDMNESEGGLVWSKSGGKETNLLFRENSICMFADGMEEPSDLLTEKSAIGLYSYLNSMVAIHKSDNPKLHSFTIPESVGYEDWKYRMIPLTLPSDMQVCKIRGRQFRGRGDGTVECMKDMYAVSVDLVLVGNWEPSTHVMVGIGIGDPSELEWTVTHAGENVQAVYISRFIASSTGKGHGRDTTVNINAQPVGRLALNLGEHGVRAGDRIFPVIYIEDTVAKQIQIKDLVFVVREISI